MTLKKLAGPAFLAAAAADIFPPAAAPIYSVVRHIHVANVTGAAATFSLFVGATGGAVAGTQLFASATVPANGTLDYYCTLRLTSTEFLSGLASAASTLTITVEGEQGVL